MNFVMSHIYMEFSKSIQSMKKHYFYSYQKPTKLVYEICSSLLVNRALVYLRYFFPVSVEACFSNTREFIPTTVYSF